MTVHYCCRSSILSNNESNVSDDYQNFNRKPFLGRVLNKPPSRPSSASCVPTDTKRKQLILAETDDRSSSETNLTLEQSSRDDEVYKTDSDKTQNSSTVGSGSEEEEKREDDIPSLPTQYKFGKFVSISDTMLPTEERDHEYIAEGPTTPPPSAPSDLEKPVKPVQLEEQVVESVAQNVNDGKVEEEPSEDETPVQYEPGKFVSQITSLSAPDQEETEAGEKAENVVPHTPVVTNPVSEHVPNTAEAKQESSKQEGTPPSNRWFDAYMKCKASQAKQKKPPPVAAKKTTATKPPVKKPELKELPIKEQPMATAPDPGMVEKDDFEKVQKITPSKSYKWLEAMQKYKALKTDTEQKCESKSVQVADEWSQGPKTAVSTPKKSSEEPTFSTLSQRAQVFGGMRKKPPLRRAKSFQVGGDNASPLATGLTRPTKVLKKQMTASFT